MLLQLALANRRRLQAKAKVPSATTNRFQIRSYAELQEQMRRDLRAQHPEWIEANGDSPMLDLYDRRLAELISSFQSVSQTVNRQKVPLVSLAITA
jgi:acyl-CoA thioesterase